jgi:type II secretory pathway component PulF
LADDLAFGGLDLWTSSAAAADRFGVTRSNDATTLGRRMLSHRRLSAWYVQLAQQLEAGLTLVQALRVGGGLGAPAAMADAMAATVESGGSTHDALRAAERWLPFSDRVALSASAEAGRLPQTLRALAARHAQLGAAKLRVVLACVYPLGILHLGLLALPAMRLIDWEKGLQWSTAAYVRGVLVGLVPLWAILTALVMLARRQSPVLTWLARRLPALRGYVKAQALADLAFTLGNFLEAGVPIGRAWAAAGTMARSPALQRAAQAIAAAVERGEPPGNHLATWPCFPPEFVAPYRTGEMTGQLEGNLARLARQYQESADKALTVATFLYPALLFALVAGAVIYFVVSLYTHYLDAVMKMAQ